MKTVGYLNKNIQRACEWIKRRYLLCLIVVDVLIVLFLGIRYGVEVSELVKLEFTQEQLQEYTIDKSIGGYIDETKKSGLYDIIPDMFLPKGYYHYTIQYEGDSPESFCWPHTYIEFYDLLEQETVSLGAEKTEGSKRFWLNADLNIALRLYYSGEGKVSFTGFCIEETNVLAKIELFSSLFLLVGVNAVLLLIKRSKKRPLANSTKYSVMALIAIALLASFPSLTGYIVEGHDLRFHITRIEGIYDGLLSGQFPVRISPTFYNGYGYATSIFYGELLLYFPAILRMMGFSLIESYNALLIVINILTVIICYYSGKKIFANDVVAVTISLLYTLSPYRLMDIYIRASIGELTAMIFLPLVAYGVYRILAMNIESEKQKRVYLPLVFGLSGIVQSHVITGEIVGGVILLACVLCCFKTLQKRRLLALIKTVIVTILVNAWFLVPFVDFMLTQDVRIFADSSIDLLQESGVFFPQLFSLFSDYSVMYLDASDGVTSEMPMGIGLSMGLGILLCITMLWVKKDDQRNLKKQSICFLVLAVITLWMSTIYFPWDRISTTIPLAAKLISSIQFVWRIVGIASALSAFVTGYGLLLLYKSEGKSIFSVAVAVLAVLSVISAMDYSQVILFNKGSFSIDENTFDTEDTAYYAMAGEYALRDIKYEVVTEQLELRCVNGVNVTDYDKEGTNITFSVVNDNTEGDVLLPLLNYKGYEVTSEDNVITNECLHTGEAAEICITIPPNYVGTISVRYKGFWYWRLAEWCSLFTVGYFIFATIKDGQRRNDLHSNV